MNRRLLAGLGLALAGAGGFGQAVLAVEDFAPYQVIIERAPFGAMAGTAAGAPQPNFAERFTFVGLVPSLVDKQPLAIIQDRERNRAELKAEGEMIGDVKVLRIELDPSKLVLKRDLEVATLTYQPRSATPAAPGQMLPPGLPATMMTPPNLPGGLQPNTAISPLRRRMPFRKVEQ